MPDALISQSSQDKQQSIIKSCSYNFTGVWINLPIGYFSVCPAAQSSRGRHLSPSALQPEPRKGFGFPPALLLTYFSMLPDVGIRGKKSTALTCQSRQHGGCRQGRRGQPPGAGHILQPQTPMGRSDRAPRRDAGAGCGTGSAGFGPSTSSFYANS